MSTDSAGGLPPPLASIALLSAVALAYEVLLTRLFSIIQWHHFAYMIISLALLGYGASGSFLSLLEARKRVRFADFFLANAVLFAVTLVAGFLLAQRVPFNALEIAWNPAQLGYRHDPPPGAIVKVLELAGP